MNSDFGVCDRETGIGEVTQHNEPVVTVNDEIPLFRGAKVAALHLERIRRDEDLAESRAEDGLQRPQIPRFGEDEIEIVVRVVAAFFIDDIGRAFDVGDEQFWLGDEVGGDAVDGAIPRCSGALGDVAFAQGFFVFPDEFCEARVAVECGDGAVGLEGIYDSLSAPCDASAGDVAGADEREFAFVFHVEFVERCDENVVRSGRDADSYSASGLFHHGEIALHAADEGDVFALVGEPRRIANHDIAHLAKHGVFWRDDACHLPGCGVEFIECFGRCGDSRRETCHRIFHDENRGIRDDFGGECGHFVDAMA